MLARTPAARRPAAARPQPASCPATCGTEPTANVASGADGRGARCSLASARRRHPRSAPKPNDHRGAGVQKSGSWPPARPAAGAREVSDERPPLRLMDPARANHKIRAGCDLRAAAGQRQLARRATVIRREQAHACLATQASRGLLASAPAALPWRATRSLRAPSAPKPRPALVSALLLSPARIARHRRSPAVPPVPAPPACMRAAQTACARAGQPGSISGKPARRSVLLFSSSLLAAFLSGTKIRCLVANCSRRCRGSSDIIPTRMAVWKE